MWLSLSRFLLNVVTQQTIVDMSCTEAFSAPKKNIENMVQILIYVPTKSTPTSFTVPGLLT